MPDGPGGFTQDSSCPALLRIPLRFASLRVRSSHALWPDFPVRSARDGSCDGVVLQPRACRDTRGLGYSPFARHYWGNHCYFLFLQVLRCFSSLRWPPALPDNAPSARWVVPFGDPSQLITSFVASGSQGIHQVPLSPFLPIDGHFRDGLILSALAFLAYTLLFLCNMS